MTGAIKTRIYCGGEDDRTSVTGSLASVSMSSGWTHGRKRLFEQEMSIRASAAAFPPDPKATGMNETSQSQLSQRLSEPPCKKAKKTPVAGGQDSGPGTKPSTSITTATCFQDKVKMKPVDSSMERPVPPVDMEVSIDDIWYTMSHGN